MDYKSLVEKIQDEIKKYMEVMDGRDEYCVGFRHGLELVTDTINAARKEDESANEGFERKLLKNYLRARYELLDCFERDGEQWAVYKDENEIVFAPAAVSGHEYFDRAKYEAVATDWLKGNSGKSCSLRFDIICYTPTGEAEAFIKHIFRVGARDE